MNITGMLILAAALSVDAFGIGASCAVKGIRIPAASRIAISLMCMILTAGAMICADLLGVIVPADIIELAGELLILFIGIYMVISGIRERILPCHDKAESLIKKTTGAINRPELIDENSSKRIELKEALYIGAAVSADSFAAGFGLGAGEWLMPLLCGTLQFLFLCAGELMIYKAGRTRVFSGTWFSLIPGVILIIIAVLKLSF